MGSWFFSYPLKKNHAILAVFARMHSDPIAHGMACLRRTEPNLRPDGVGRRKHVGVGIRVRLVQAARIFRRQRVVAPLEMGACRNVPWVRVFHGFRAGPCLPMAVDRCVDWADGRNVRSYDTIKKSLLSIKPKNLEKKSMPKTKKKARDPNRPKKPMTAFLLFSGANRGAIKSKHPDMQVTEISKELGKRWRESSDKAKSPFVKEAKKLKKKYDKEKAKYDKEKAKHAPPKRPWGSYFRFCGEMREDIKIENPGLKITEYAKLLGAAWRDLSEAQQAPYKKAADKEMEKWKAKMEKWRAKQQQQSA